MKKVLGLIVIAALQACSSKVYNNKTYLEQTSIEGKKIAILPVDVELTGRLPKGMTVTKKNQLELEESKLIQNQIFGQYLYKSKKGSRKRKAVDLINVDLVNSRLQEKGVSLREAWTLNPDSLGRLVGADLVLKVRVKKNRIMSETASLGIGVAGAVLDNIFSKDNVNTTPGNVAKTYNIFLDATLTDVNTHAVITKFKHSGDASWNHSPEQVIESSGRKIIRKGALYAKN